MTMNFFRTVFFMLVAFPLTAGAQDKVRHYVFDKDHTNIIWFAGHKGYSKSMGQFMDYSGDIVIDKANPAASSMTVVIKTGSIMTGLAKFDAHLKSPDFFNVGKYPTATFKSTKVTLDGENKAVVEGNFTMLGKTNPVTLKVKLNKMDMDYGAADTRAGFSAKTTLKRSLWGMKMYVPFVSDDIKIIIEAELVKK